MKNLRLPLLALGASLLAVGAAQATTVSGTGAFSDLGPAGNGLIFSAVNGSGDNQQINLNLTAGQSANISDFLTIDADDTNYAFFGNANATDNVQEAFTITEPGGGSGNLSGSGTEDEVYFLGFIDGGSGSLTWQNPLSITLNDGAVLSISLQDVSFNPSYGQQDVQVNATVKLVSDPTAVPEPGALALLASGLLGLCVLRRRFQSL